jgi:hypothetical protein
VLRMERLSWRALRPLLLAGAAATAWLTLSAPGASADGASDPGSLLSGVSSSVSSVREAATSPVGDILAGAASSPTPVAAPADVTVLPAEPSSTEPAGLVQPLTGAVDHVIAAVPVVNQIVPTGSVGAVTAPVIDAADGIVAGIAQEVLPAAGDTLPVLEPVVEPVSDLLDGVDSLPDNIAAPVLTVPDAAGAASNTPAVALPLLADTERAGRPAAADVTAKAVAPFSAAVSGTLRPAPAQAGSLESPGPRGGSPGPSELPAVPGSGSGSSQSSSGGAGGTAWLSTFHLDVPLTGVFPVSGPLQNAPAPVSFDPGSSPD